MRFREVPTAELLVYRTEEVIDRRVAIMLPGQRLDQFQRLLEPARLGQYARGVQDPIHNLRPAGRERTCEPDRLRAFAELQGNSRRCEGLGVPQPDRNQLLELAYSIRAPSRLGEANRDALRAMFGDRHASAPMYAGHFEGAKKTAAGGTGRGLCRRPVDDSITCLEVPAGAETN